MITRATVIRLGLSQLLCWGVSFYLVGVLGERMADDTGWSLSVVHAGFSLALLVMGLVSGPVGRAIDRHGGRPVMTLGSIGLAAGLLAVALAQSVPVYLGAWIWLGLAMRMCLYDAAFASLARIGGPLARRPISQITLLGGLASTVLWPIGSALADGLGWRGAVLVYAGIALSTIPLHLAIPPARYREDPGSPESRAPRLASAPRDKLAAAVLYATIVTLSTVLNSAMSAHMIGILAGLGMGAGLAVWIGTLRGIGQSAARLCEVLFGGRLSPLTLCLGATGAIPLAFALGLMSGEHAAAGVAFALGYGAGNGLLTIVRGTLPLVLFDTAVYGALVGRLIAPGFLFSALAPYAYALAMEHYGAAAGLHISGILAVIVFLAALLLWLRFRRARR